MSVASTSKAFNLITEALSMAKRYPHVVTQYASRTHPVWGVGEHQTQQMAHKSCRYTHTATKKLFPYDTKSLE